jgi:predicted DNA-binding antitoxin AbrB/MazE fold protein
MSITIEATVKKGQLRLKNPIGLADGTPVRVTIRPLAAGDDPLSDVIGIGASGRTDGADRHDKYLHRKRRQ